MIDYDGLNRLAYQIKTETGRAANTALRVGTLFEDIIAALAEGDNTGLLDQITNLKNDISKIINMIKDLNTEIDTSIISRIEANERNISDINSTINKIDTSISNIKGDINTINGSISNHTKLIEGLQGDINTINESITSIKGSVENITNTISDITTDIEDLTTRVSTNETNITELTKRLDAIDLKPIIASIDKLKVGLTALTSRVSSAEIEINALNEFTSALSRQITEEIDRATEAEAALDEKFNGYLPLAGGTMKGYIHFDGYLNGSMPIIDTSGDSNIMGCMGISLSGATPKTFLRSSCNNIYLGFGGATNLRVERSAIYREAPDNSLYTIWDKGNDGHNSGLDADLLDGHHWEEISSAVSGYIPLSGTVEGHPVTGIIDLEEGAGGIGFYGHKLTGVDGTPRSNSIFFRNSNYKYGGGDVSQADTSECYISVGCSGESWFPDVISKLEVGYKANKPVLNYKFGSDSNLYDYKILHEGNSVYVVSAYPTDLSSYPDGAIFIKTS